MRNLLAIDAATRLGWAAGVPGRQPICGSHLLPKGGLGAFLLAYRDWLVGMLNRFDPGEVAIEAPINVGESANFDTDVKLKGLTGVTALICEEYRIGFSTLNNLSMKKYFAGHGKAKKFMMMDAARLRGWEPPDHNAADALAAWEFRIHQKRPDLAMNYSLWRRQHERREQA